MQNVSSGNGKAVANDDDHHQPTPLFQASTVAEPVPYEALGPLKQVVKAIEDQTQAPGAIAMQSVLATASLATQGFADVETLSGRAPLSLFLLTIAESGERKSTCDGLAISAIRQFEEPLVRQFQKDLNAFRQDEVHHKKQRRTKAKSDFDSVIECVGAGEHELPTAPVSPRLLMSDITLQGVTSHFENGRPSIGIFSDEGGQFFGGYSMKSENRLHAATSLSKLWDGKEISRVRSGSDHLTLYGKRTSVHLMIQPDIARNALGDQTFKSQGLWSRFLIAWPESKIGWRVPKDPAAKDIEENPAILEFRERILDLLEMQMPTHDEDPLQLTPHMLGLTSDTRSLLLRFYERVEIAQREGEVFSQIRGFASKAVEHAARIAGVLTIYADADAHCVSYEAMKNAITLLDWYLLETERLLDTGPVSQDLSDAQTLLDWLREKWDEDAINIRAIVRRGPNKFRSAVQARQLVSVLEKHGWLVRVATGATVLNQKSSEAWRVVDGE